MRIIFSENAWNDYIYWQQHNPSMIKKINKLIKEIQRDPADGIGKPEPLMYQLQGCYSRRINLEHRLVYQANNDILTIYSLRYHYKKKD